MDLPPGWEDAKLRAWTRLWEDLEIGYLDTDILEVLLELFARPKAYPVSSCSGRVVIVDSEYPWERNDTNLIFKKHGPVSLDEVLEVIEKPFLYRLWLNVQGPIYHVYVADLDEGFNLLEVARQAGFKHSGILSCSGTGCVVELRTGVRMSVLIADSKGFKLTRDQASHVVGVANEILRVAKSRNNALLLALRSSRPSSLWTPAVKALEALSRGGS
jgi:tRNA wybutosine-synthesizing protein 3